MSDFPSKAEAAIDRIARMSGFEEAARTVTFRQPDPVAGRPSPETSFSELMAKMVEQEEAGRKLDEARAEVKRLEDEYERLSSAVTMSKLRLDSLMVGVAQERAGRYRR